MCDSNKPTGPVYEVDAFETYNGGNHDVTTHRYSPDAKKPTSLVEPVPEEIKTLAASIYGEMLRQSSDNGVWLREPDIYDGKFVVQVDGDLELYAIVKAALAAAHTMTSSTTEDLPEYASSTDDLVARFSAALRTKLQASEKKYRWENGWEKDDWRNDCQRELARHVAKGDPLDVATYAAFCWHHGWATNDQNAFTVASPSEDTAQLLNTAHNAGFADYARQSLREAPGKSVDINAAHRAGMESVVKAVEGRVESPKIWIRRALMANLTGDSGGVDAAVEIIASNLETLTETFTETLKRKNQP